MVLASFLIRWVFTLPEVLFGGQRPGEALRGSARIVRGAYLKIGGTVFACLGAMVLLPGILTWLVNLLDVAVFDVAAVGLRPVTRHQGRSHHDTTDPGLPKATAIVIESLCTSIPT